MIVEQQAVAKVGQKVSNNSLVRGRIMLREAGNRRDLRYYLYWPQREVASQTPAFVTVHGISINAREQARMFAPWAEQIGTVLIAPLFDPAQYKDFQRLGRAGLGARADIALNEMLEDAATLTGCNVRRIALFGFSGGGQFAHRYTLLNSNRVVGQVLAAPGWYTFPTKQHRYPYGLRQSKRLPGAKFRMSAALSVDTCVVVGGDDTQRDDALRATERVDLQQGFNRVERATRWIQALRDEAANRGMHTRFDFRILPNCTHDFGRCMNSGRMGAITARFLYGERIPTVTDREVVPQRRRGDDA